MPVFEDAIHQYFWIMKFDVLSLNVRRVWDPNLSLCSVITAVFIN
jgi:hypothetical protein